MYYIDWDLTMSKTKTESSLSSIQIKELNMNRLFCYVYHNGPVSISDLSTNLSLSVPTVNHYLREFAKNELIIQSGSFDSTGGRKAVAYKCNPTHGYGIGVYVTQSYITITIINLIGEQIISQKIPITFEPTDSYGKMVNKSILSAIKMTKIDSQKIYGVGFSIPGISEIVKEDIVIKFSPSLHHNDWSFNHIGKYCEFPFIVDNDANLGGFYEAWGNDTHDSFAYLHIAGGVGGAIILNGEQFFGNSNATAEFGHMIIRPQGSKCNCGRDGCLETYISKNVLSEGLGVTLKDFFYCLETNNKKYIDIFDNYLLNLCIGISNIRLALGLEVVIAGEITEYLIPYENVILEKLNQIDKFESEKYFRFTKNKKENASSTAAALRITSNYISKI